MYADDLCLPVVCFGLPVSLIVVCVAVFDSGWGQHIQADVEELRDVK